MAHKRLIAFMLTTMLATSALTGCSDGRDSVELKNEDEIREMLEYDANTNLSRDEVKRHGLGLDYTILDEKFYITFKTCKILEREVSCPLSREEGGSCVAVPISTSRFVILEFFSCGINPFPLYTQA